MTIAEHGKTVHIHYTGRLTDGTIFDSSNGRDPLAFEMGSGQVIPGLDAGLRGMALGDKKTIEIPFAQAYGEHYPEGIQTIDRTQLPPEIEPQPGMQLQASGPNGEAVNLVIITVEEATITMDANHPLAGKDLIFDVELVAVS